VCHVNKNHMQLMSRSSQIHSTPDKIKVSFICSESILLLCLPSLHRRFEQELYNIYEQSTRISFKE